MVRETTGRSANGQGAWDGSGSSVYTSILPSQVVLHRGCASRPEHQHPDCSVADTWWDGAGPGRSLQQLLCWKWFPNSPAHFAQASWQKHGCNNTGAGCTSEMGAVGWVPTQPFFMMLCRKEAGVKLRRSHLPECAPLADQNWVSQSSGQILSQVVQSLQPFSDEMTMVVFRAG